ncbi:DeoR/GlpR family DNA-binding transcription regulator [Streptomyces sp. DG2A-72]|uniref:DeoR/GlpR family DNA-binding transcription regulator n=1 Tax=Streptomyces sp. DG2A-72 TaxID=3051386 RepID=UPI00265B9991|nr:DeoR/GlpR family DNA-binding transcription regulator [Streptomyces sp. DG2A-72]MDO0938087.1 DeoR/GlpR family DNA-binding transcription regulator [Streptomyces sp. DG2A-72]
MELSERHLAIMNCLRESGQVDVSELAQATGASEVTIRRDLEQLAALGALRRVRGGAVSDLARGDEPPFVFRELDNAEAKHAIGTAVAELVQDGEAVLLDGGTTALHIARALAGRRVTVMPLSLQAANVLSAAAPTRVILPGGDLRPGELAVNGPLAEASLRALRFDTAILTCCGVSVTDGITTYNLADAAVKRLAITQARRVLLAADASKFTRTALAMIAPLDRVDVLVTDGAAPQVIVDAIEALGVATHRG